MLLVASIQSFAVEVGSDTRMHTLESMRTRLRNCQSRPYDLKCRDTILTLQRVDIVMPELRELLETTILPLARELKFNPKAGDITVSSYGNDSFIISLNFCLMEISEKYVWTGSDIPVFFRDIPNGDVFVETGQKVKIKHQLLPIQDFLWVCDAEASWKCSLKDDIIESIELSDIAIGLQKLYPDWMLTLPRMRRELVRSCISPPKCEIPAPSPEPIKPEISI